MPRLALAEAARNLLLLLLLLLACTDAGVRRSEVTRSERSCEDQLRHIPRRVVTAVEPPNVKGIWVSRRCEVRPGPEFIIRKYHFISNSRFRIFQYYYSDPQCSLPFYTLTAQGVIDQTSRRRSLIVPGSSTFSRPKIKHVVVFPYSRRAALYLQSNAAGATHSHCRRFARGEWQARERYVLLNLIVHGKRVVVDVDCTDKLGFTLNEMQLIRLDELRRPGHINDRELHLGSVSTEFEARASHRPSSFQDALVDVTNSICDESCEKIRRANTDTPPVLSSPQPLHSIPYGRWVSVECENQRQGRFLSRLLRFSQLNDTWEGDYFSYHDHRCRRPFYDIYARGTFYRHSSSLSNPDSINYDFFINQLVITPRDDKSLMLLNSYRGTSCGYPGEWMLDTPQDVTSTGGCSLLGLYVPEVKQQTLKLELDYSTNLRQLFVGQLPNTVTYGLKPARPTAFQRPLVECRSSRELEPTYSAVETRVISPPSSAAGSVRARASMPSPRYGFMGWTLIHKSPILLGPLLWFIRM